MFEHIDRWQASSRASFFDGLFTQVKSTCGKHHFAFYPTGGGCLYPNKVLWSAHDIEVDPHISSNRRVQELDSRVSDTGVIVAHYRIG